MNAHKLFATAVLAAAVLCAATTSEASTPLRNKNAKFKAQQQPWHGGYYNLAWGQPVAVVVPPTAGRQTKWGWGVTNTEVRPIWHQYERAYPGPATGGVGFAPTPYWPSHTDQFGYYYIRGPW
jgi:hypothetical protein